MRAFLKKVMPEFVWPLLREIDRHIIGAMYYYLALKYRKNREKHGRINTISQSVPVYNSRLLFVESADIDITSVLDKSGIHYKSGRHSAYISNKKDLAVIAGGILGRYPEPFGLKIIKSRQMSPDGTPYYTSEILAPASTRWSMEAVGSVYEKVIVSNLLHNERVAPRVYDLVKLKDEYGNYHFALVVEHIEGTVQHGDEGFEFICHFKKILSNMGMTTISISEHSDLRPPLFRDNIIRSDTATFYVDIQNFVITEPGLAKRTVRSILERYSGDRLSEFILHRLRARSDNMQKQESILRDRLTSFIRKEQIVLQDHQVVDACRGVGSCMLMMLEAGAQKGILMRPAEEYDDLYRYYTLGGITRVEFNAKMANSYKSISCSGGGNTKFLVISDQGFSSISEIAESEFCSYMLLISYDQESGSPIENPRFILADRFHLESSEGILVFSFYRKSDGQECG